MATEFGQEVDHQEMTDQPELTDQPLVEDAAVEEPEPRKRTGKHKDKRRKKKRSKTHADEEASVPDLPVDGLVAHVVGAMRDNHTGPLLLVLRPGFPTWWDEGMISRALANWICRTVPTINTMRQGRRNDHIRMRWPAGHVVLPARPDCDTDPTFPRLGRFVEEFLERLHSETSHSLRELGPTGLPLSLRDWYHAPPSPRPEFWVRVSGLADPLLFAAHAWVLEGPLSGTHLDGALEVSRATVVSTLYPTWRTDAYVPSAGALPHPTAMHAWREEMLTRLRKSSKGRSILLDAVSAVNIGGEPLSLLSWAQRWSVSATKRTWSQRTAQIWPLHMQLLLAPRFATFLQPAAAKGRKNTQLVQIKPSSEPGACMGEFATESESKVQGLRAMQVLLRVAPRGLAYPPRDLGSMQKRLLCMCYDALCLLVSHVWEGPPDVPLHLALLGLDGNMPRQIKWLGHVKPVHLDSQTAHCATEVVRLAHSTDTFANLGLMLPWRAHVSQPQRFWLAAVEALRDLEREYQIRLSGTEFPLAFDTAAALPEAAALVPHVTWLRLGHEALCEPHALLCATLPMLVDAPVPCAPLPSLPDYVMVEPGMAWTGLRSELVAVWDMLVLLQDVSKAETVRLYLGGYECPKHFLSALVYACNLPRVPMGRCGWTYTEPGFFPNGAQLRVLTNNTPAEADMDQGPVLVLNAYQLRPALLQRLCGRANGVETEPVVLALGGPRPPKTLRWQALSPLLASLLAVPESKQAIPDTDVVDETPAVLHIKAQWPEDFAQGVVFARQPASFAQACFLGTGPALVKEVRESRQVGDLLFVPSVWHASCTQFNLSVLLDPEMSSPELAWASRTRALHSDLESLPMKGQLHTGDPSVVALMPLLDAAAPDHVDQRVSWPWQPLWQRFKALRRVRIAEPTDETDTAPEAIE